MDERVEKPYMAQDPREVAQVIRRYNDAAGKSKRKTGFRAKKKTFVLSDGQKTVDSWMLNDWDYKKGNLPCYARGFFTHQINGKSEIAVRGYDKFFNVGEVRKTEWTNVEANTRGPYELSVKENGCIIFIAGLDDETLIVTSKHSTGARQDGSANHALAGEGWIDKQLTKLGKTRKDLAKRLREMNATAVAELCDDEFEEHVLPYEKELAGLYLHGINLNLPEFATYSSKLVADFADEWGFRKVTYIVKQSVQEVRPFLESVAETGSYDGRDTEGFVIRCQARDSPGGSWHDWFFKYKFEEPYLMYRQWREATKAVIAGKLPKYNKHKKITDEYVAYARRRLNKDPYLGKLYSQNHGIIAMRVDFLEEKGMKGSDIIRSEIESGEEQAITRNVVLVPVATLGCGKTTVALGLAHLFGWGHKQNDNIEGKRRPQRFAIEVINSMSVQPVVVADRNNHQLREREQIISDVSIAIPDATFVALNWVHEKANYPKIRQITRERVLSRGDNHQTIQAGTKSEQEIVGIMDGFLQRFEPVDPQKSPDNSFDLVINLDAEASSLENMETIIHELHTKYPQLLKVIPSSEDMEKAINDAMSDYKPNIKHDLSGSKDKGLNSGRNGNKQMNKHDRKNRASSKGFDEDGNAMGATNENELFVSTQQHSQQLQNKKKQARIEYFGAQIPAGSVAAILESTFSGQSEDARKFYNQLKANGRIQRAFHTTLVHRADASANSQYWDKLCQLCHAVTNDDPKKIAETHLGTVPIKLKTIVWNERVMAIAADLISDESSCVPAADIQMQFSCCNEIPHVTVGTAAPEIKPFESNALLKRWKGAGGGDEDIKQLRLSDGSNNNTTTRLVAQIKAVLTR